jgi:hypothetical protein
MEKARRVAHFFTNEFDVVRTPRNNKQLVDLIPEVFKTALSRAEKNELVANCDRFKNLNPLKNKTRKFELLQGRPGMRCHKSMERLLYLQKNLK